MPGPLADATERVPPLFGRINLFRIESGIARSRCHAPAGLGILPARVHDKRKTPSCAGSFRPGTPITHQKGKTKPVTEANDLETLRKAMEEAISRIPVREIVVPAARVREFREILGRQGSEPSAENAVPTPEEERIPIPESYLLTLLAPLSHDLFTAGIGHLLGDAVLGIIHTSSVVEFYDTLYCDTPYRLKLGFSGLVRKRGRMGGYLVGTFPHEVYDHAGNRVASDRHVFFLRTRGEIGNEEDLHG